MGIRLLVPLLVLAIAAPVWSAAIAADATESGTEIHLAQQVERDVPRDRIHASVRVEAEGTDPVKVQAEVNRHMAEALALAKQEPSLTIETSGYSVYQEPPATKDAAPKWRASQSATMTGKDFAATLAVVGALQGAGLLVEGLSFDLTTETLRAVEDDMTTQALTGLRDRAEHVAGDLGMKIERYKSIEIGNATTGGGRPMPRMMSMATSAKAAPPAAEAGESTVSLTVEAQVIMAPVKTP